MPERGDARGGEDAQGGEIECCALAFAVSKSSAAQNSLRKLPVLTLQRTHLQQLVDNEIPGQYGIAIQQDKHPRQHDVALQRDD